MFFVVIKYNYIITLDVLGGFCMQISKHFILREIAGEYIVVPTEEEALRFQGLIALNESAALLWKSLQESPKTFEELVEIMCDNYEVEKEIAEKDIKELINLIEDKGMIINE